MRARSSVASALTLLALAGCVGAIDTLPPESQPAPPLPVIPAQAAPPADPDSVAGPDSMRWLYGSGEAAAASHQAFTQLTDYAVTISRQRRVPQSVPLGLPDTDGGIGQPSCVEGNRTKPLAVIFDVDETVLLNLGAEYAQARAGGSFDPARWAAWEAAGSPGAVAVPGAVAALARLREAGITPVFNTNRAAASAAQTAAALAQAGLGAAAHRETLWLRGDDTAGSGKDGRRALIAERFCVIAQAGDNLGDFADRFNDPALGIAERRALVAAPAIAALWGRGWFVLPNPVYGPGVRGTLGEVFPPAARWTPPTAQTQGQ